MATSNAYQNGEAVHYESSSERELRGPGMVLGTDGKEVLIKHGRYIMVIPCYIQAVYPKSSFDNCEGSINIKIPLNHATNNSSSVFALRKNPASSPSDCIKVIDDFLENLQTIAPSQNSRITEDLNDFS